MILPFLLRPRKLPARFSNIVMPLLLSLLMTFIVSAISTFQGLGLSSDFLPTWLASWGVSWLIAFPTLLALLPLVRRIVSVVCETPHR